jgi:hypothetical protein
MVSTGTKIKQLAGLCGTPDVSVWIEGFINGIVRKTQNGADTSMLTDKQIDVIEAEWRKHFA